MNSTLWPQFIQQQHANLQTTSSLNTGGSVLCALVQLGTLRVTGDDAQSFLQNLLSNDIREVSAKQAQWSSFNTAKGRMLALFLVWQEGSDYLLQLPVSLVEPLRKKLSMYVLRAKVKISDADVISLGLSGDAAQQDGAPMSVVATATGTIIKMGESRLQFNTTSAQAPALWSSLQPDVQMADAEYWDWLNIRAGIPAIVPVTQEQFVPQMVNLDLIGGINFKKGCYPGQEIVARMHYLGKLKRRMYLAHLDSATAPQAGDELYSEEMAGQACGMIANAVKSPRGGYDVLAVLQSTSHDQHTVHLGSLTGMALAFESLPYALPAVQ